MSMIYWGERKRKRDYNDDQYENMKKKIKTSYNDDELKDIDLFNFIDKLLPPKNSFGSHDDIKVVDNNIYFYCGVSTKSILDLTLKLRELGHKLLKQAVDSSTKPPDIYLHINSPGGSLIAAKAAIDAIIESPVPVVTIVEGWAASAGTLMSVTGSKRYIKKNAVMLIHQLSAGFWGKMEEIKDEFKNLEQFMEWIKEIYGKHANIPKAQLRNLLKHDLILDANKCLEYGLVDEIGDPTVGFINFNT